MSAATQPGFFRNPKSFAADHSHIASPGRGGGRGGGSQSGGNMQSVGGAGFGRYTPEQPNIAQNRGFGPSLGDGGRPMFGAPPIGGFSSPAVRGGLTAGNGGVTQTSAAPPQGRRGGSVAGSGRPQTAFNGNGRGMNNSRPAGFQSGDGRNFNSGVLSVPNVSVPPTVQANMELNKEWLRMEEEIETEEKRSAANSQQQQIASGDAVVHNAQLSPNVQQQLVPEHVSYSASVSQEQWGNKTAAQMVPSAPSIPTPPAGQFSTSGRQQKWGSNAPVQTLPSAASGQTQLGGAGLQMVWNPAVEPSSPPGPGDVMAPFSAEKSGQIGSGGPPSNQWGAPASAIVPPAPTCLASTINQPASATYHQPAATHQSPAPTYQPPVTIYQPPAANFQPSAKGYEQPAQQFANNSVPAAPNGQQQHQAAISNIAKAHRDNIVEAERRSAVPAQAASSTDTCSSNESPKKQEAALPKSVVIEFAKCFQKFSEAVEEFKKFVEKLER